MPHFYFGDQNVTVITSDDDYLNMLDIIRMVYIMLQTSERLETTYVTPWANELSISQGQSWKFLMSAHFTTDIQGKNAQGVMMCLV